MLGDPYAELQGHPSKVHISPTQPPTRRPLKRRDINGESSDSIPSNAEDGDQEPQQHAVECHMKRKNRSLFDHAKRLFHRSAQVRIVGRTAERAFIERFWSGAQTDNEEEPRVLYICGNPGAGKTALINEMLPELLEGSSPQKKLHLIKTNCMMHHDPREILLMISKELKVSLASRGRGGTPSNNDRWEEIAGRIEDSLRRPKNQRRHSVLVLDEVDQIAMKDAPLLERILSWPSQVSSHMVIIGIANALDLSIRYFSAPPEKVSILNFAPYSPEDISRILVARMELANDAIVATRENCLEATGKPLISPQAVEICARKVSAVGDLRQALEIMREAIGLAERQDPKGRVEIGHVATAIERVFGTSVRTASRHAQLIGELNLHQKLLLATLHRLVRDSATLKPTIQSLYDRYTANVRLNRIIDAVSRGEFNDLVANSESMGVIALIAPGKRKTGKNGETCLLPDTKVLLSLPLEDVATSLSDNPVLKQLL